MKLWTIARREVLGKLAKYRKVNVEIILRKQQELFLEFRTRNFQVGYPQSFFFFFFI